MISYHPWMFENMMQYFISIQHYYYHHHMPAIFFFALTNRQLVRYKDIHCNEMVTIASRWNSFGENATSKNATDCRTWRRITWKQRMYYSTFTILCIQRCFFFIKQLVQYSSSSRRAFSSAHVSTWSSINSNVFVVLHVWRYAAQV